LDEKVGKYMRGDVEKTKKEKKKKLGGTASKMDRGLEHVYNTDSRGNLFFCLKYAWGYAIIADKRGWGVYLGAGGGKRGRNHANTMSSASRSIRIKYHYLTRTDGYGHT
jgi:hypothetical protein